VAYREGCLIHQACWFSFHLKNSHVEANVCCEKYIQEMSIIIQLNKIIILSILITLNINIYTLSFYQLFYIVVKSFLLWRRMINFKHMKQKLKGCNLIKVGQNKQEWKIWHDEESVREAKSRKLLWAEHVAELRKYKMLTELRWESSHFEDWEVHESLIRLTLRK
jgi:hypothetical protein